MIAGSIVCVLLACAPTSAGAGTGGGSGWELTAQGGIIRHDAFESVHVHPVAGLRAARDLGSVLDLGARVDWWPDRLVLGPLLGGGSVDMDYVSYGLELSAGLAGPGGGSLTLGIGAGAETVLFGDRAGAAPVLPEHSTYAAASVGAAYALAPLASHPELRLRLELRALAADAPGYGIAEADESGDPMLSQMASIGVSYGF